MPAFTVARSAPRFVVAADPSAVPESPTAAWLRNAQLTPAQWRALSPADRRARVQYAATRNGLTLRDADVGAVVAELDRATDAVPTAATPPAAATDAAPTADDGAEEVCEPWDDDAAAVPVAPAGHPGHGAEAVCETTDATGACIAWRTAAVQPAGQAAPSAPASGDASVVPALVAMGGLLGLAWGTSWALKRFAATVPPRPRRAAHAR